MNENIIPMVGTHHILLLKCRNCNVATQYAFKHPKKLGKATGYSDLDESWSREIVCEFVQSQKIYPCSTCGDHDFEIFHTPFCHITSIDN